MKKQDLQRHLSRFDRCLTSSLRNEGKDDEERYYHFTTECMEAGNKLHPYYKTLSSFMYALECDNNSRYKYTAYAITTIIERNLKSLEELEDLEMCDEADNDIDVYTNKLTTWLAESVNNVYYLSEVLSEFEPKDGFQALTMAQGKCIEEIYAGVRDAIVEFLKTKE